MSSASKDQARDDRRRAGRVRCGLTTCQYGKVMNISKSGMRVLSRRSVPDTARGVAMKLVINAAGRTLTVLGRPVNNRARPDGQVEVGFQFVGITEEQGRELMEFARIAFDGLVVYRDRQAG